ncbi:type II secretion system F family protein [Zwartia sp.]|uniref:type II secretion system F family protein n=1 Tax=Zwartia sp. TaxID=2978004 RepID=UPI002726EDE8|nr:type II secretion system F family protein [Zwartia sp.]MDO9024089.1 type II secretion system F family protein [Zwartia sp.]
MIYIAILCGLIAIVLATFAVAMMAQRFRQLADPAQVQRLKGAITNRGVGDVGHHRMHQSRLRHVFWLVTCVLGTPLVPFVTWGQRRRLAILLDRAGLSDWGFAQIFLLQCSTAAACSLVSVWLFDIRLLSGELFYWIVFGSLLMIGWWIPILYLKRLHQYRVHMMSRQLPFFLDMVGLGLDAGLNLQASIQLALEHVGAGALHQEWSIMLADMRAGQPRVQALRQLSQRLNISSVRQLISSLIQGEAMGFSLGRIIQVYADQQRAQRLMLAEKLALQAPVKMLFPMALCIFPCTFIVLGFPVVVQLFGLS